MGGADAQVAFTRIGGPVEEMSKKRSELLAELKQLRETEVRYQRLTENASDVIAEVDGRGRFLYVSPNTTRILGYAPDQIIGKTFQEGAIFKNVHPDDRESILDGYVKAIRSGSDSVLIYRYRHGDGRWRWFESKGKSYQTPEGQFRAVLISRDVTDREQAQRELSESRRRYSLLTETSGELITELDPEGRVLFMSPSCEALLGYKVDELVGTTPFGLVHPDDIETVAKMFLNRVESEGPPRQGHVFRVRHRDGSWRWFQGSGVNYVTEEGEPRIMSVCREVTHLLRVIDERQKLEKWVEQAQKYESLGVMAGGVAHDFNNLLTPILGDAALILMDLPMDSPLRPRIEKIQRAAHQAANLTNQMLDYAGMGSRETTSVNVSKLVLEMGQLLESVVTKKAQVSFDLAVDLPSVDADAGQLGQVVINLITNASEAIEAKSRSDGRIAVRSGQVIADRQGISRMFLGETLPVGPYVYFEVEDTGCGMDAGTRARIFDPFFTTKFTGRGLGMASVVGIIRKHRGAIDVESRVESGTRVRVLLPVGRAPLPVQDVVRSDSGSWRSSGVVLVADDDEGVLDLMCETLMRAGLEVRTAARGDEAIEIYRRAPDEIRAVLLDRTMPGTPGEDVLQEILAIRPDARILIVSGYSEQSSAEQFAGKGAAGFLQKPFLPETLLEKVRALIEN